MGEREGRRTNWGRKELFFVARHWEVGVLEKEKDKEGEEGWERSFVCFLWMGRMSR